MPPPRRAALPALLVLGLLVLGGCASDPPTVSTSGVDMLEIPTPSPDPDDFATTVDNPWLPALPGAQWEYETGAGSGRLTATGRTRAIAGVTVTELRSAGALGASVQWLAQDRDGNVWLFGVDARGESWEAGVDGARASLAMPADPRRGDGWVGADPPGDDEARIRAVEVTDSEAVLETTATDEPGVTVTTTYERGTGPVLVETDGVQADRAELVEFTAGSAAR